MRKIQLLAFVLIFISCGQPQEQKISLAGEWEFALDSNDEGIKEQWYSQDFNDKIMLPGTTDDGQKGIPNLLPPAITRPQVLRLTRKHSYVGPAWYKKEVNIPSGWEGKSIGLKLERVIWGTSIWVDGKLVDQKGESLIAPHYFDLTDYLSPGKHTLCLRIDNRKKYDITIDDKGHAYTNETQIMWNGVIGELCLIAEDQVSIKQVDVYPDLQGKNIKVKVHINNNGESLSGKVSARAKLKNGTSSLKEISLSDILIEKQNQVVEMTYPMGDDFETWSELTPSIYELSVSLKAGKSQSTKSTTFGMREIKQQNGSLLINGNRVFMRGTLECCIFPLTGHPPMDKEGWEKVMKTAREWGLNHLRFHSWCPPKAAFEVGDELGFYLQIELPLWSLSVGRDPGTNKFLYDEADRIIAEYGNHPSFCFFSMGNELSPDFVFLRNLMLHAKEQDSRHLYAATSFTFNRAEPGQDDDFFITQWTKEGWVRGQGVFDAEPPCFNKDYTSSIEGIDIPIITHEVGQYAVYPNLKEIEKYTGVLDPLNFKGVKKELEDKNMIHKADDYTKASGKLAALLYKEEIERALKTPGFGGFQLLDLHDFPGQGSALVGLLDAFWDSKGIMEPEEFRQFCSPVVPLIHYPKATYTNMETFNATVEIANYGITAIKNLNISWTLENSKGQSIMNGKIENINVPIGRNEKVGNIDCSLAKVLEADEYTLSVSLDDTGYMNSWRIWIYPESLSINEGNVVVTDNLTEAEKALKNGRKVLFNPPYESLYGLEGKFVPVFWSPVHFPKQAGTMGILCNPNHKLFANFPTRMHSDWQWWNLLIESKTLVVDSIYQNIEPIVECVDNFANNRKLATLFETNCEQGKLIVCSMDLLRNTDSKPEKQQLLYSILNYMNSAEFNPEKETSMEQIASLIDPVKKEYKRASAVSIY